MLLEKMIEKFKKQVTREACHPEFIHHKWFVKYHLEIVENIANELCDIYPEADRDIVHTLVWLHDYEKIMRRGSSKNSKENGRDILMKIGFPTKYIDKCIKYVEIIDNSQKLDISKQSIEVMILSSADGAAHLIGPFFSLWFYENVNKDIRVLMDSNNSKVRKDWDQKIVLPEVRKVFKARMKFILEQNGTFPEEYLK